MNFSTEATTDALNTTHNASGEYSDYYYSGDDYELMEQYLRRGDQVSLYWKPSMVAFSVVGNALSVATLLRRELRGLALTPLLVIIACLDVFIMLGVVLPGWLNMVLPRDHALMVLVRVDTHAQCKVEDFLFYLSTHLSSLSIVLLTVERFLVSWFPLKAKELCTRKKIMSIWLAMLLVLVLLNAHLIAVTEKLDTPRAGWYCSFKDTAAMRQWYKVWVWVDMAVLSMVPFIILIICNSFIILSVYRQVKKRKAMTTAGNHGDTTVSLTVMLVSISLVFTVTTFPVTLLSCIEDYLFPDRDTDPVSFGKHSYWFTLLDNFYYLNYTVNFIFYMLCGSQFRKVFIHMFCGCCLGNERKCVRHHGDVAKEGVMPQRSGTTGMGTSNEVKEVWSVQ